jgi:hypothetical protein
MNWDGRQSVVDALGSYLSDREAAENTEIVWSIIEQAMKQSNEHSATIDPKRSLYNFFEEAVQKLFTEETENEAKKKRQTILDMSEMWGAFVGSPIQQQSLKFFWMEECIDGENLFVADTYKKVLEAIAKPAENEGIHFQHRVKKLVSNTNGKGTDPTVTVEIESPSGCLTNDTFDEVVMTAPLGWLKMNLDMFEPALPQRLQQGIESIGYGHLDKVSFSHPLMCQTIDKTRSTSPSQPHSGTCPPLPLLPTRKSNRSRQPHQPSPTSPQHPHPSTNSALPTRPSTPRTTRASHPSSRLRTPCPPTLSTGIKKPSTSPHYRA